MLLNARSACNKGCLIPDLILAEKADLACVTETCWAQREVFLSQKCAQQVIEYGTSLDFRAGDRLWCGVVIRKSLVASRVMAPQVPSCETLVLSLAQGISWHCYCRNSLSAVWQLFYTGSWTSMSWQWSFSGL